MPRWLKILVGPIYLVCLAFAIFTFIVGFAFRFFVGGEHETVRHVFLAISIPAVLIGAAIVLYAFVWVCRHLKGAQRTRWVVGFLIGGSVAVPVWWWRLIRPLPDA